MMAATCVTLSMSHPPSLTALQGDSAIGGLRGTLDIPTLKITSRSPVHRLEAHLVLVESQTQ